MSKKILFTALALILVMISSAHAEELTVKKTIAETELQTGGSATIQLNFTNPFGEELKIKIVDKNVMANNGVDIQCMEMTLPPNKGAVIQYTPIQLFQEGEFTLSAAEVTYTNPDSGDEEEIKSNKLEVTVEEGSQASSGGQGITTIYQCDGQNMQSTSFSSSGSNMQVSMTSSMQQQMDQMQQQMNEQMQQQASQMQQKKNAAQNSQMDQDAGALKQEMQRQREEFKQMQQELAKKMGENEEIMKAHQDMLDQGYNMTNMEIDPETNDTGNFKMNYQKANGESGSVSGKMQDGQLSEMQKQSPEEERQMMEQLKQNPQFQNYSQQLQKQGFNQTAMKLMMQGNTTQAVVEYKNPEGQNANISADFINQTINKVEMNKEEDNKKWWKSYAIPIILLLLALLGYWLYRKYFKKKEETEEEKQKHEKPIDYHKEARKMIEEAKRLFAEKKEKDAYERASQAIRLFYTHKLGYKKELTNSQTINVLKKNKIHHNETQKCLNMCGMVEFAKYEANRKDFLEIIKTAENIVNKS